MKKHLSLFFLIIITPSISLAQAALPVSWNFSTTTLPVGWTESNVNSSASPYYTGSGNPSPAYKFDTQNDMLTLAFTGTPGVLTFDMTGTTFSATWQGTMLIEESANGSTWTTLLSPTLTKSYSLYTAHPNTASRFIRFNFSMKVGGHNVGLDNVNLTAGISPKQEINIKQNGTSIINGGSFTTGSPVSTNIPITFAIHNLGLDTLHITGITITGPDAADFIVGSFPTSIADTNHANFNLDFTPSALGTRTAVMSIANNDISANPYIIDLNCVGGNLATEPVSQPSNLTFPTIKSYRIKGSFTAPIVAPTGYLILKRFGTAVTDVPVDGTVYQKGDLVGNSVVVSSGTSTSFFPSNVIANTTYHFAIFAYNGTSIYRNYLSTSPLTGSVTSLGSMQSSTYYTSVITSASNFIAALHTKINPHAVQSYNNYGEYMVTNFMGRDTINGQRVLTCVYSGQNKIYTEPWDWATNNFSREHTFCHNWMPTNPAEALPEYNDYHHLFPTNLNNVNILRSNYPLGEVVTATQTFLGCKFGLNAQGKNVFEPQDADKGDVARAMMYMAICYNGVSGNSWAFPSNISTTIPYGQDQNILKKWHYQDPPDNFEIARNDYVDSLQGNRNPFIDSMHYACYIDFSNMTKINSPFLPCNNSVIGISDNEKEKSDLIIIPNPNNGNFLINYTSDKNKKTTLTIYSAFGNRMYTKEIIINKGTNTLAVELDNLSAGIYLLELAEMDKKHFQKIIITEK